MKNLLENFTYSIENDKIILEEYIGTDEIVEIPEKYKNRKVVLDNDKGGFGVFKNKKIKKVILPNTITEIPKNCFLASTLEEIIIPDSVKIINENAFANCFNLKKITLPKNLIKIPYQLFHGCYNLENIILPDTITEIDHYAFTSCMKLKNIHLSKNLKEIKNCVFEDCEKLEKIELPNNIMSIGAQAFKNTNLRTINLPETLKEIGDSAFEKTRLDEIKIPNNIERIGSWAFCDTNLTKVELPNHLGEISMACFERTKIKEIVLPDAINTINNFAFHGCKNLETIKIPKNIQTIYSDAFLGCDNLKLKDFENQYIKIKNNNIFRKEMENDKPIYFLVDSLQKNNTLILNENEHIISLRNENIKNLNIKSLIAKSSTIDIKKINTLILETELRNYNIMDIEYINNLYIKSPKCILDYFNSDIKNLYYNGSLEQLKKQNQYGEFNYENLSYKKNINELLEEGYSFKQIDLIVKGYDKNILLSNINLDIDENILRDIINNFNYDDLELYDILEILQKEKVTLEDQLKIQEIIKNKTNHIDTRNKEIEI